MTERGQREIKLIPLSLAVAITGPIIMALASWVMAGILIPKSIAKEISDGLEKRIAQERELHEAIHKRLDSEIETLVLNADRTKLQIAEIEARYNRHIEALKLPH